MPPASLPFSQPGSGGTTPDDAALMVRVAAQDTEAFTQLYRRFAPGLFSMVHEIVGPQEAEDVLQEAFVQMWKRAATYDSARSSVFTWAVMIARHKAIDRLRARQRHTRDTEVVAAARDPREESSDADSGSVVAAQREDRLRVLAALEHIPADQREAIDLAFFSGLSHSAISSRLNAPLGTVKARIRRGLLALGSLLPTR